MIFRISVMQDDDGRDRMDSITRVIMDALRALNYGEPSLDDSMSNCDEITIEVPPR